MLTPSTPQAFRVLAPGDRLGRYELIRQIAVGGMAELYLARTVGLEGFEKLVVIKRILPQHVHNQQFVTMFLNEARLAATLHHPNIAQVYDIGRDAGDYFFSMEYVHGEDLARIAMASNEQGVPLSMDASLTLVAGLCAGLHYAHVKVGPDGKPFEIVHRDVSPSNVIVSYDGAVKLVDFGIARARRTAGTTSGLKGKVAYMSPEQCQAKAKQDRRSDIFSVGMLLYEVTTGQLPFKGETDYAILNQIVNDDVPPPSTVVSEYPPALERIVMKALARDPDRRYTDALTLQGEIEDFAHESRLRISPLVLGRLIGTLFPARLEDWDHAKAQGAFFVEQHVVRTLIESGKTPDPDNSKLRRVMEAVQRDEEAQRELDSTTMLEPPPPTVDLGTDTSVGLDPITTESARVPHRGASQGFEEQLTRPRPPPPPAEPRLLVSMLPPVTPVAPMQAAIAGTLVTSAAAVKPLFTAANARPDPNDVTEHVRIPSKLARVHKVSLIPAVAGAAIAVGIAAAVVMRGRSRSAEPPVPSAAVDTSAFFAPPPPPPPAPPPPAPTPAPVAAPPPAPPPPTIETKVAEPPPPAPAPAEPPKKRVIRTPPKPKPKEQKPWNADSPFLPVRTDKH